MLIKLYTILVSRLDASASSRLKYRTSRYQVVLPFWYHFWAKLVVLQSFLGFENLLTKTGSGISAIVRLLLMSAGADLSCAVPLQDSKEYNTSSGVHLYAAPEEPGNLSLLYVDCKGLVDTDIKVETPADKSPAQSPPPTRRRFSSIFGSVPRETLRTSVETPLHSPQWIMSNIYSHLMYNISDVVVLVFPHSRYFTTHNDELRHS